MIRMQSSSARVRSLVVGRRRGPVVLAASAVVFAGASVLGRTAGLHGIPGSETALAMCIFGIASVTVLRLVGRADLTIRRPGLLVARGVIGGLSLSLGFLSLAAAKGPGATTLTNAVLLGTSYFVYVPLFAALLIGEKLRLAAVSAMLVAAVGMWLVVSPSFSGIRTGDLYAVGNGIAAALVIVTVRELSRTEPGPVIFLSLCFFGAIVAVGTLAWQGAVRPDAEGWIILAGVGATTTVAQLMMNHAFRFVPAGEGSLITMTTIVYSSLAGIFLFHEPLTRTFLVGAVLVLASAGYLALTTNGHGGIAD